MGMDRYTRRRLLRGAGGAGVLIPLAGCGGSSETLDDSSADDSSPERSTDEEQAEPDIRVVAVEHPDELTQGDDDDLIVEVENAGQVAGGFNAELALENGETYTHPITVEVAPNETTTVTVESALSDLAPGNYTVHVADIDFGTIRIIEDTFTWQDILDHEYENIEARAYTEDPDLIGQALNGEPVGENYDHDLSNWETSYSHGSQSFDLAHFTSMELGDVDEFQDILNDAITLGIHYYSEQIDYPGPSESSGNAARTAQLLIDELQEQGEFEDHNLHLFGAGNDNHGFAYALSEQHGLYLIDSTSERSGPSGAGVLSDRAGYDRIKQYDWDEIQDNTSRYNILSNFLSNTMYHGGEGNGVRHHLDLIPEAMEMFDTTETDNGEYLMNTLRPAKATLMYEFMVDDDLALGEDVIAVNPDSLYDLPDFRDYGEDHFEEYREELDQHIELIDFEEAADETFLT